MAFAVELPDYYSILRVSPFAPVEVIREAYKRLALRDHPDKNRDVGATERFQRLAEAWETLKDNGTRAEYDRELGRQRSMYNEYWWDEVKRRRDEVDQQARANWHPGQYPHDSYDEERIQKANVWKEAVKRDYLSRLERWIAYREEHLTKIDHYRTLIRRHKVRLDAQMRLDECHMVQEFEIAIQISKEQGQQIEDHRTTLAKLMNAWKNYVFKLNWALHEAQNDFQQLVTQLEMRRACYEEEEAIARANCVREANELLGPCERYAPIHSMIDRRGQAINHWNSLLKVESGAKCFAAVEGPAEGPWYHDGGWQRMVGEHTCGKCKQNAYHLISVCGPAKCSDCGMTLCNNCFRDLDLLREYQIWILTPSEECKNSLFSLDFKSGIESTCIWEDPRLKRNRCD